MEDVELGNSLEEDRVALESRQENSDAVVLDAAGSGGSSSMAVVLAAAGRGVSSSSQ